MDMYEAQRALAPSRRTPLSQGNAPVTSALCMEERPGQKQHETDKVSGPVQGRRRQFRQHTAIVSSVWPLKNRNMTEKKETEMKFWPLRREVGASRVRMNMVPVMVAMTATWHTRKMYRKL